MDGHIEALPVAFLTLLSFLPHLSVFTNIAVIDSVLNHHLHRRYSSRRIPTGNRPPFLGKASPFRPCPAKPLPPTIIYRCTLAVLTNRPLTTFLPSFLDPCVLILPLSLSSLVLPPASAEAFFSFGALDPSATTYASPPFDEVLPNEVDARARLPGGRLVRKVLIYSHSGLFGSSLRPGGQ